MRTDPLNNRLEVRRNPRTLDLRMFARYVARGDFVPKPGNETKQVIKLLSTASKLGNFPEDFLTNYSITESSRAVTHLAKHLGITAKEALNLLGFAFNNPDLVSEVESERRAYDRGKLLRASLPN